MSSKGVLGIQCLAYRCGYLCEHVEHRETVLSVRVATEQDLHSTKKNAKHGGFCGVISLYTQRVVGFC